jgi:hypothetical protein
VAHRPSIRRHHAIGRLARQTSGSTKNVASDELTWFAIEVADENAPFFGPFGGG